MNSIVINDPDWISVGPLRAYRLDWCGKWSVAVTLPALMLYGEPGEKTVALFGTAVTDDFGDLVLLPGGLQ